MDLNVSKYSTKHSFGIFGTSYIGAPKSNTAMFVSKKIEHLVVALTDVDECLVFAEDGLSVPQNILERHCFVFSSILPMTIFENLPIISFWIFF